MTVTRRCEGVTSYWWVCFTVQTGTGDGDPTTGSRRGETEEGGAGEKAAGGDQQEAETCREGGEAEGEAEIAGEQRRRTQTPPASRHTVEVKSAVVFYSRGC